MVDVELALEQLRQVGSQQFALGGLCAAADDAIFIAPGRRDIVGLLLLDGYVTRNWKYHTTHFLRRLRRVTPAKLLKRLKRLLGCRGTTVSSCPKTHLPIRSHINHLHPPSTRRCGPDQIRFPTAFARSGSS